jgi:hypothetical protein
VILKCIFTNDFFHFAAYFLPHPEARQKDAETPGRALRAPPGVYLENSVDQRN